MRKENLKIFAIFAAMVMLMWPVAMAQEMASDAGAVADDAETEWEVVWQDETGTASVENGKPEFVFVIYGAYVVAAYVLAAAVATVAVIYIGYTAITYSSFPTASKWYSESVLETHYSKHVINGNENWGNPKPGKDKYDKMCKDVANSKTAAKGSHIDGNRLVAYDKTSNIFVVLEKDGKIVTCFKPDDGWTYVEKQVSKWLQK